MLSLLWTRFFKNSLSFLQKHENVVLAFLALVIVASGSIWFRQYGILSQDGPRVGGTYVEGVIGEQSDVERLAAMITKVGLFRLNQKGELEPELIDSYEVNSEKTEYRFLLKNEVPSEAVVSDLTESLAALGSFEISVDGQNLTIRSLEPVPNLNFLLATPLIDLSGYKLGKVTSNSTIITRSGYGFALQPNINRVVLRRFATIDEANEALKKRRIDGIAYQTGLEIPDGFLKQNLALPRYYAVLVNINRSPFRDQVSRLALFGETSLAGRSFVVTVIDQEPLKAYAEAAIAGWRARGAAVELRLKSVAELSTTVAISRDFQVLITGIDYGLELDPFYIWHSSQILPPGNNLTGIRSEKIDSTIQSIRAARSLDERQSLVTELHRLVEETGAAKILDQAKESFVISQEVEAVAPSIGRSIADRFLTFSSWWIR